MLKLDKQLLIMSKKPSKKKVQTSRKTLTERVKISRISKLNKELLLMVPAVVSQSSVLVWELFHASPLPHLFLRLKLLNINN